MQAGFVNGDFTRLQHFDFAFVNIYTADPVPQVCKTGPGYEANITNPYYGNVSHLKSLQLKFILKTAFFRPIQA